VGCSLSGWKQLGGIIGYSIDQADRMVFHHPSAACFRYDDAGHVTFLNPQVLAGAGADEVLITQGAVEALRQESERDPHLNAVAAE
jgi:hypothetical protein